MLQPSTFCAIKHRHTRLQINVCALKVQTDLPPAIEQISLCLSVQTCAYIVTACVYVSVCVAGVHVVGNSLLARDFSLPRACAERALER